MYDVIIVGAGAAGLAAAIYAARFRLKTLILGSSAGSTLVNAHLVENWPGIVSVSGFELLQKLEEHAKSYGIEMKEENVQRISRKGKLFLLKTNSDSYECRAVILATGTARRKLNVPGEPELKGKGVSYCAACDAALFRDKVVAVVGGSDSAAKEALLLAEYASKVYIIYRKHEIRAEPINRERVQNNSRIEIVPDSNVTAIIGESSVEKIKLDRNREMKVDGVFIETGSVPASGLAEMLGVKLNEAGEIIVDSGSATSMSGVYAAGDVTSSKFKQAITAAAQGVAAAYSAYNYIKGLS